MLSENTKERIIKWGKVVKEIMDFYHCDEPRAWQILAVDNNWKTAVVAEKIERMKEEERRKEANKDNTLFRFIKAVRNAASKFVGDLDTHVLKD